MYGIVKKSGGCGTITHRKENALLWSTDPARSCAGPVGPFPINLAILANKPDKLAAQFKEAFNNPTKYVQGHWHYRQTIMRNVIGK